MKRSSSAAWGRLGAVLMPLIDLVMLLVLFFALAQGVIQQQLVQVALPEATEAKETDRPGGEPVITVTRGGALHLSGEPTGLDSIASELSARGATMVRLRGDGSVNYGTMKRVLSVLREEGVPNVRLMVTPETSGSAR